MNIFIFVFCPLIPFEIRLIQAEHENMNISPPRINTLATALGNKSLKILSLENLIRIFKALLFRPLKSIPLCEG